MLLWGRYLRLESRQLGAASVGLRRSEIDGYWLVWGESETVAVKIGADRCAFVVLRFQNRCC